VCLGDVSLVVEYANNIVNFILTIPDVDPGVVKLHSVDMSSFKKFISNPSRVSDYFDDNDKAGFDNFGNNKYRKIGDELTMEIKDDQLFFYDAEFVDDEPKIFSFKSDKAIFEMYT